MRVNGVWIDGGAEGLEDYRLSVKVNKVIQARRWWAAAVRFNAQRNSKIMNYET